MDDATVARIKGYAISKAISRGVTVYSVWKLPSLHLGNYKSADDAKAKVAEDLAQADK